MSDIKTLVTESIIYSKGHPEFVTVTCLGWKALLEDDKHKDVITSSLDFLTKQQRILVYAFVIMSNHFHLIWQMLGDHKRDDVQRDFLKYTGQQILKILSNGNPVMLNEIRVNAKDGGSIVVVKASIQREVGIYPFQPS